MTDEHIRNPHDVVKGLTMEGGAKPISLLVRFTRESLVEIHKNEVSKRQFLHWLNHEVFGALDDPVKAKENFATMEVDEKVVKPPLGIVPEWLWKEARMIELRLAMKRRVEGSTYKVRSIDVTSLVGFIARAYVDETLMTWVKEYSKLQGEIEVIEIEKKLNI